VITAEGLEHYPKKETTPLAYAMYTSGSTGRPKAVAVAHRALAARVRWMRERYAITPAGRVLQFSSPSFDTFGEEVYPCLAAGASLVIPTGARAELPDFLATAAVEEPLLAEIAGLDDDEVRRLLAEDAGR
jgi:non-ribosomal peptide synthetase component F